MNHPFDYECGSLDHVSRRTILKAAGLSGLTWLTPLSQLLARDAERHKTQAKSVIALWLAGGPSQLETFDPHPGTTIAGPTGAIETAVKDIQLATGFERFAEVTNEVSIIRSLVSKEGDHERAMYNIKTGFRPDPTLVHPAIGSLITHELPEGETEIPRHISILPNQWPSRGGYLGSQYDAFKIYDPKNRIPDVVSQVDAKRQEKRLNSLSVIDGAFAKGRRLDLEEKVTLSELTVKNALKMMSSDQLKAFDVKEATAAEQKAYGDTPFGRGCLTAVRLIEAGVRCVEITLGGWDTHINNYELHQGRIKILDPALTALIKDLKQRDRLKDTIVLCGGEFGRTPNINPADGRDHWPHGFSMVLAGGGIRGGHVIGETDPEGIKKEPANPIRVAHVHATILHTLGIEYEKELMTPVNRPMQLSEGRVIRELLAKG